MSSIVSVDGCGAGSAALPPGLEQRIFKYSGYWVNRFGDRFTMELKTERRSDRKVAPVAQGYTGHLFVISAAFVRNRCRATSHQKRFELDGFDDAGLA